MKYIPNIYQKTIFDINYKKLKEKNIKCLVFDLDNTLGLIKQECPSKEVKELFKTLKKDFHIFILSNNSKIKRVEKYASELNVIGIHKALKPFTRGLKRISKKYNFKKEEMAIIGDQIVTDIYAGKRYNITTILVDPLNAEEDLWITKFNRLYENFKIRKYKREKLFERGKYYE